MVSVLVLLPARELTDLGTEPYQETLTLILKPQSAVFLGGWLFGLGLGFRAPNVEPFLWLGLILG